MPLVGAALAAAPVTRADRGAHPQDLGNTNYCVFVPRNSFERRTNAKLVARALERASIPAFVNDRNDICVDSFKASRRRPR